MSDAHLSAGSDLPPKTESKLRLYSMLFCPYAQRARLILKVKGIPHDVVNVNLKNKPQWLFELNPKGQVPILDTGSKIITESLVICDYLEQEYPDPPLYPKNDAQKNSDKELISSYANMISIYYEALWNKDNKTFTEYVQNLKPYLERLQQELEKRGKYFGGESPGMADYMLWPWVERTDAISLVYEEKPFSHTVSNRFNEWCRAMRTQNAVTESQNSTERYLKLIKLYRQGNFTDYDSV